MAAKARKATHRQRAVEALASYGWEIAIVEHFETRGPKKWRVDLFGFADLLCVKGPYTLAVQVTSPSNVSSHVRHLLGLRSVRRCLEAGWNIEIWGVRDAPVKGSGLQVRAFYFDEGRVAVREESIFKS
jgi:hypothetical protein